MKNKKNLIITGMSICLILILWAVAILTYVDSEINRLNTYDNTIESNNNNDKTDNTENNIEKVYEPIKAKGQIDKDILFIGYYKGEIYAIKNNGKSIKLMNIDEYNEKTDYEYTGSVEYTYTDGILYLIITKSTSGIGYYYEYNTIGYIDLTDNNYTFNKITNVEVNGSIETIAVADDKIYYSSTITNGIYDMKTKEIIKSDIYEFKRHYSLYNANSDTLVYFTNKNDNEEAALGIIDLNTNTKQEICTNGHLEYIYNDKVIFNKLNEKKGNELSWTYYEYNLKNKTINQISDSTIHSSGKGNSSIIPIENYYVYANKNKLYKYSNNKAEQLLELDGDIDSINLTSSNKVEFMYGVGIQSPAKYATFDLSTLELAKLEKAENPYFTIKYIK